eukprot:TRINITY_DN88_c0_g1_i1.p1 TRINITY_DN88_c0_g1~~TRINITY_DN88_c0_g1_i1.p1  ORF type:complete len:620 (-),score=156.78 TRINITY_DN88_c0_g1_i1:34-1893(-)
MSLLLRFQPRSPFLLHRSKVGGVPSYGAASSPHLRPFPRMAFTHCPRGPPGARVPVRGYGLFSKKDKTEEGKKGDKVLENYLLTRQSSDEEFLGGPMDFGSAEDWEDVIVDLPLKEDKRFRLEMKCIGNSGAGIVGSWLMGKEIWSYNWLTNSIQFFDPQTETFCREPKQLNMPKVRQHLKYPFNVQCDKLGEDKFFIWRRNKIEDQGVIYVYNRDFELVNEIPVTLFPVQRVYAKVFSVGKNLILQSRYNPHRDTIHSLWLYELKTLEVLKEEKYKPVSVETYYSKFFYYDFDAKQWQEILVNGQQIPVCSQVVKSPDEKTIFLLSPINQGYAIDTETWNSRVLHIFGRPPNLSVGSATAYIPSESFDLHLLPEAEDPKAKSTVLPNQLPIAASLPKETGVVLSFGGVSYGLEAEPMPLGILIWSPLKRFIWKRILVLTAKMRAMSRGRRLTGVQIPPEENVPVRLALYFRPYSNPTNSLYVLDLEKRQWYIPMVKGNEQYEASGFGSLVYVPWLEKNFLFGGVGDMKKSSPTAKIWKIVRDTSPLPDPDPAQLEEEEKKKKRRKKKKEKKVEEEEFNIEEELRKEKEEEMKAKEDKEKNEGQNEKKEDKKKEDKADL